MNNFSTLTKRNTKLFFKDKGMFFCSLITPIILLVLYITFLGKIFRDSFVTPDGIEVPKYVVNAVVSGQLLASLLSVSCVTIAFGSNMIMVQDKITGARKDLLMTPLKKSTLAMSYYVSSFLSTLLICLVASVLAFIYMAITGWCLNFTDILLIVVDIILATLFGTALSSIVNFFLNSQGQLSAVGTIVSSMYGFICGAYMPIATFGEGLQKVLMFLPGTYLSSMFKNHAMRGALSAVADSGVPKNVIEIIKNTNDCNLYFFDNLVSMGAKYGIVIGSIIVLIGIYILLNSIKFKPKKARQKKIKLENK